MARKKWLKRPTVGGGALLVLLIAMVVLNPSEKKQRDAIYDVGRQAAEDKYGKGAAISVTALKLVDGLRVVPYKYNNYYVFSTITLSDGRVTFGVLGYVNVNENLAEELIDKLVKTDT